MKNKKIYLKKEITFLIPFLCFFILLVKGKADRDEKETRHHDSYDVSSLFSSMSSSKSKAHKNFIFLSTPLYRTTIYIEINACSEVCDVSKEYFLVRHDEAFPLSPLENSYMTMTGRRRPAFLEDQQSEDLYVPMGQENDIVTKFLPTVEQENFQENFYDSLNFLSTMDKATPYTSIASIPLSADQEKRFCFSHLKFPFKNLKFFRFFTFKKRPLLKSFWPKAASLKTSR